MPEMVGQQPLPFVEHLTYSDGTPPWTRPSVRSVAELPPLTDQYAICPDCQTEFDSRAGERIDGEHVCVNCVTTCSSCGEPHRTSAGDMLSAFDNDRARSQDGVEVCDERGCYWQCDSCSNRFTTDVEQQSAQGGRYCQGCYDELNLTTCCACGDQFDSDDIHCDDDGGEYYCLDCWRNRARRIEAEEAREAIHGYTYSPRFQFHRAPTDRGNPAMFGVELEIDRSEQADDETAAARALPSLFYAKRDGSLTHGFEVVSHPASWAYWEALDCGWLSALKARGYRSYRTTTCGMHVHVSRSALTELDTYKLLKFFKLAHRFIVKVSRRQEALLGRWARIDINDSHLQAQKVKRKGDGMRYQAINLEPDRTVEFRLFRGTLDAQGFIRNLAFVVCCIAFVKETGIKAVTEGEFRRWVKLNASRVLGRRVGKNFRTWIDSL